MAKNHYINNKDFLKEMIAYRQSISKAKRKCLPKPKIPDTIAKCFMMIAENLSHKPNFLSYTFRDEMVADAIENCVMYVDNFDPNKSSNPFAYFTQIAYYAFLRRIQKEKKQNYIKFKSIELAQLNGKVSKWLSDLYHDENKVQDFFKLLALSDTDMENFEGKKKKKVAVPKKTKTIKTKKK